MTQVGGPAAINGFLYQIIHHLGWLAEVSFQGKLDGQEIQNACLVLEPRNGGDARAEAHGVYLVEQYKTRHDGTWSVAAVITVLKDLRKSISLSMPDHACYRFVTDGRPGRLSPFWNFLAELKNATEPNDLDNATKNKFSKTLIVTNREFFEYVVRETRANNKQSIADERAGVFHLLAHFEIEFESDKHARAYDVERLLRPYAPNLGEERNIRQKLVGLIIEKLSKGEAKLRSAELKEVFKQVGLSIDRLYNHASAANTMAALLRRRLAYLKYNCDEDIRTAPDWPQDSPVMLISGESGCGKTWQLGRFLDACVEMQQVVTLIPTAASAEDLMARAARDFWQTGLGETTEKSLVAISAFLREIAPNGETASLTIAIDDIQDADLARSLIRQDWADWNMRLVLTIPHTVARSVLLTDGEFVHHVDVGDFSVDELDKLLSKRGQSWQELPEDLRTILRKPILAGLFLSLPHDSVQTAPRSEYEIFSRYWERILSKGQSSDSGVLIALAAHMLDGEVYPIPREKWHVIGLADKETLMRLENSGWVGVNDNGEIAFTHDRLLNWAVAKSFVQRLSRNDMSIEELGTYLTSTNQPEERRLAQRLGYVPMDILWLLAEDSRNREKLAELIGRLEESQEYGSYGSDLYVQLLPTLGERVIPILLLRLENFTSQSGGDYRVSLIGEAFAKLARQEGFVLRETLDSLLSQVSIDKQAVAIAALTAAPDSDYLDRLWQIHGRRCEALVDEKNGSRFRDYEATHNALRIGILLNPYWLKNKILTADEGKEPVSELAFLLNGLEHSDAPTIWKATRETLMTKLSSSKPRCLLYCIGRFSDKKHLSYVVKHLSVSDDFASGAAIEALTILDPDLAVDRLIDTTETDRYINRNRWLPAVLHASPEKTLSRILEIAAVSPAGYRLVQQLFSERPNELDEKTLDYVLESFENDLQKYHEYATEEHSNRLSNTLDFLSRVSRPKLLAHIESLSGSDLEMMITKMAYSRLARNSNMRDHVLESCRHVLILIGGSGIADLVTRELESKHYWVRHSGIKWSYLCNRNDVIQTLSSIAQKPIIKDEHGNLDSDSSSEFHQSVTALGALGSDEILVDIIWDHGMSRIPVDLADLRSHRGAMSQSLTEKALQTLESNNTSDEALTSGLAIAWLSADVNLIPAVRQVLTSVPPGSEAARYACIALRQLGDQSPEYARLAKQVALTKENVRWGLSSLIGLNDGGLAMLEEWINNRSFDEPDDIDNHVIRALYDHTDTRELAIKTAVSFCQTKRFMRDPPYDIAAEVDDQSIREQILDKAFAARSFALASPLSAIEGLAKFDVERAIQAIELALRTHPQYERSLCRLLTRVSPVDAGAKLIKIAISAERGSLRNAVGRSLRRLDRKVISALIVDGLSGSPSTRKPIAELAKWLPSPEVAKALDRMATHDNEPKVRRASLVALESHRNESIALELLAEFQRAAVRRQWTLLFAILGLADPYLLTDSEDQLWLGNIFNDASPMIFEHFANSMLKRRKKKLK